jgi:hypothetical protein
VNDVPADGFAEGALSRIHYLFLEDLTESDLPASLNLIFSAG